MGAVKQQSNIIKMAAREEREGIIYDNPEKFYEFEEEIGSGKMATVKKVKSKTDGKAYAAKMIYFDDDTRFAIREFDLMKSGKLAHKGLVQMHEAYMVRKYLILILDLVDGKTLLHSSLVSCAKPSTFYINKTSFILTSDQPTSDSRAETSNFWITTVPVTWPTRKLVPSSTSSVTQSSVPLKC